MASSPPTSWKVDLLGRAPVQASLDLGQGGEHGLGPVPHPRWEASLVDQAGDVGVGSHNGGVLGPDVDLGGGHAPPQHGLGLDRPPRNGQAVEDGPDLG